MRASAQKGGGVRRPRATVFDQQPIVFYFTNPKPIMTLLHPSWFAPARLLFGARLALLCAPLAVFAQPSGGPYGPIPQRYELPADAGHIYYVAPDGKPGASGKILTEPTSIEAAIERVVTGDAI